ncbi:MAG: serine hydrolase domain-containing protein [Enterobacterales bacterium]|nr:serine hydrolase domain-containing protein [Enterobacterales bacterium]
MKRILLGLVLFNLSLNTLFAADISENQNEYQAILAKYIPADGPGAAVIVSQNGQVLFEGAAGLANIELNIDLTTESVFRLGSITKQFTAAAIIMLQEQKKLSIKDDIHKYVPNFPTEGNHVTIEHLLTHTSGIANYTEDQGLFRKETQVPTNLDQMLVRFAEHPMSLKTGEAMRYSNTGYVLLGKIIEVASGQSYLDFIEQNIFKKLDMKSSRYGGLQIIPNRASGYNMSPQGVVNTSHIDMTWPHAAGALLSTVGDLDIWFKALRSGKLISKASYQQMVTPFKLNDGSLSNYGFGLGIGKLNKYDSISHNGGIPGFATNAVYLPEEDLYVAVLTNLSSGNPNLISNLLVATVLDIQLPNFKAVKLNKVKAKSLMGSYKINNDSEHRFFMEDGKAYTQRDKGDKYEVFPMSDDSFYYENSLSYFVIKNNDKGQQIMNFYFNLSIDPQRAVKE